MALTFNATNQWLSKSSAVVTAVPFSMAAWTNLPAFPTGAWPPIITVQDATGANTSSLQVKNTGGCVLETTIGGTSEDIVGTSLQSINTWFHICGVYYSTTSRAIWTNGGNQIVSSISKTLGTYTMTQIGGIFGTPTQFCCNGLIAFAAIWNAALDDQQVASLGAGISPLRVRPQNLVAYLRMSGGNSPEPDLVSATGWTVNGAPTLSANPRIYRA